MLIQERKQAKLASVATFRDAIRRMPIECTSHDYHALHCMLLFFACRCYSDSGVNQNDRGQG